MGLKMRYIMVYHQKNSISQADMNHDLCKQQSTNKSPFGLVLPFRLGSPQKFGRAQGELQLSEVRHQKIHKKTVTQAHG